MKQLFISILLLISFQALAANQKPVPVATATPTTGYLPLTVQLDGSGSYDPDGQVVSYEWKFGGGDTLTGSQVSYQFSKTRKDSVRLTVTDNNGKKESTTINFDFLPDDEAPVLSFELPDDFELRVSTPTIAVEWEDQASQVDLSKVEFILDGVTVTSHAVLSAHSGVLQFTTDWPLAPGPHKLKVVVQDYYKNKASRTLNFSYAAPVVRPNQLNGLILDTSGLPVAGAQIISVAGPVAQPLGAVTDAQGRFALSFTVAGDYQLKVSKAGYLDTYKYKTLIAGTDDVLDDVYIAIGDTKTTTVQPATGGTATNTSGSISLVIPPGSLDMTRDLSFTEAVTGKTLQVPLPNGSQFTYAQNNQPSGTQFSSPATMTILNVLGFPAGTEIPAGVTAEGLGVWEDSGHKGIVSQDGTVITFSVDHFSDYDVNLNSNRRPGDKQEPTDPEKSDEGGNKKKKPCPECDGSRINGVTSELHVDYALPSVARRGSVIPFAMTYSSNAANPYHIVTTRTRSLQQVDNPVEVTLVTDFVGIRRSKKYAPVVGTKASVLADGFRLFSPEGYAYGTGTYQYWMNIHSKYVRYYSQTDYFGAPAGELITTGSGDNIQTREETFLDEYMNDRAVMVNNSYTPYGSGWTINGAEKLTASYDGTMVFEDGTGHFTYYLPVAPNAGKRLLQKRAGDSAENLMYHKGYFYGASCESNEVYRIDQTGRYTTLLSNQTHRSVDLNCPTSVYPARKGGYYVADSGSGRILYLKPDNSIKVLASKEKGKLFHPTFVTEDNVLAVHFVDGDEIKTISPFNGEVLTMVSGHDKALYEHELKKPTQIHYDRNFNLLVLDEELGQLIKFYVHGGTSRVILDKVKGLKALTFDPVVNRYYLLDAQGRVHHWDGQGTKTTVAMDMSAGILKPATALYGAKSTAPKITGIAYSPEVGLVYATANGVSLRAQSLDGKNVDDLYYVSPTGEFSTLVKHANGSYTRTLLDRTIVNYDSAGYITQRLLTNRTSYSYQYDSAHKLTRVDIPGGGFYSFVYYSYGLIKTITDPAGRVTTFNYDDKANLVEIRNPEGEVQRFTYDANHLLTSHTDERNLTKQYEYQFSRVTRITYPDGRVKEMSNGLVNHLQASPDSQGRYPRLAIEDSKTVEKSPENRLTQIKLDKYGLDAGWIDGNGNRSYTARNDQSRPIQETSAEGRKTYRTFDSLGRATMTNDARGVNTYTYHPIHQKIQMQRDAFNRFTYTDYNAQGLVTYFQDKRGKSTNFSYDANFNLIYIGDMLNNFIYYERDTYGNIISIKDKANNYSRMTRDPAGNMLTSTDPLGYTTNYQYDSKNQVTQITDAKNGHTQFTYLPTGQLESVTDASNHTTSFEYSEQYVVTRMSNHLGQEVLYTHDQDGNTLTKKTKAGDIISYGYDGNSKLITKSFNAESASFSYDKDGLLVSMSDNDSSVQRTYDRLGRLQSEQSTQHPGVVTWSYNEIADNTETYIKLNEQAGISIQRNFDENSRLFSIHASVLGQTVDFSKFRNDLNDVVQYNRPNGIVSYVNYDANSRPVDMTTPLLGNHYMDYRYTANGNISSVFEAINNSSKPNLYEYDELGRLIKEQTIKNKTYQYDAVGNDISNGGQYNELNQLLEDNDYTFTYDSNGNLTRKEAKVGGARQEYTWNADSQMIEAKVYKDASTHQYTISYKYDASGRRIQRFVQNHLNSAKNYIQKFVYDQEHIVAILDGSNQVQAAFVFDEGIDEPIAMVTDYNKDGRWDVLTYIRDRQNSVKMLVNDKKEIVQEVFYSAYGETQIITAGQDKVKLSNPFYYTSRELEPELGIYYYRARYYDPSVGRFLSEDPIGFAGGDYNLYRYVGNNPVLSRDPAGTDSLDGSAGIFDVLTNGATISGGAAGAAAAGAALTEIFSKPKQEVVNGDYDTAQDDFLDELIDSGGKDFDDKGDGVFVGEASNGDRIVVRPNSSNGMPTLEIQDSKGRPKSKKRYCGGG